jgi:SAM-dependent methyltransferase
MTPLTQSDHAALAYDCLAPYYDAFTSGYAHEEWLESIERWTIRLRLTGKRALDLACGTGRSAAPLLARGYSVTGCDISEAMVREAQRSFPEHAQSFVVADMRELPPLGEFDLVLCLDDAVNYLLSAEDLEATFRRVGEVLAPEGMFVFDVNSLATYRSSFAQALVREDEGLYFSWRGETPPALPPGELASASVEVFARRDDGLWERRTSRHLQRHHPTEVVERALERAGLRCRAIAGQRPGGQLEEGPDEERHIKLVYFAARAGAPHPEGGDIGERHLTLT